MHYIKPKILEFPEVEKKNIFIFASLSKTFI